MNINIAHVNIQGQNCLICAASPLTNTDSARKVLLDQLVKVARTEKNLQVDKAALAYSEHGRPTFFGTPDLVDYLANNGLPGWNGKLYI